MSSPGSEPQIPSITTDQMREVDRAMVEEYGILLVQMMENARLTLAHLARARFLNGDPRGRRVLVLAGTGGNGGGGLVCARRLHNWGANVHVVTTALPSVFKGVPGNQLGILRQMDISFTPDQEDQGLTAADLIVDAIIGYSLRGAPTGVAARLIRAANAHGAPILSLDIPSGIDAATGTVHDPSVRAVATLTLALPKIGLHAPAAIPYVGELYLGDISVPPRLYANPALGLMVSPIFAKEDIVRLR